jgi:hypothetical protein
MHPTSPEISLNWLWDEKTTSINDVHLKKPVNAICSTGQGMSIRHGDVHSRNPEISLNSMSDEKKDFIQ